MPGCVMTCAATCWSISLIRATIAPDPLGAEVHTFFGCWLDINQRSALVYRSLEHRQAGGHLEHGAGRERVHGKVHALSYDHRSHAKPRKQDRSSHPHPPCRLCRRHVCGFPSSTSADFPVLVRCACLFGVLGVGQVIAERGPPGCRHGNEVHVDGATSAPGSAEVGVGHSATAGVCSGCARRPPAGCDPDARGAVGLGWAVAGAGEGRWQITVPVWSRSAQGAERMRRGRGRPPSGVSWRACGGRSRPVAGVAGERASGRGGHVLVQRH